MDARAFACISTPCLSYFKENSFDLLDFIFIIKMISSKKKNSANVIFEKNYHRKEKLSEKMLFEKNMSEKLGSKKNLF